VSERSMCLSCVRGASAGAFVQDSPVLSWVGNNTAKLQLHHPQPHAGMQCWTLLSTNQFGQVRRVPAW
jgi:hypothetical protein